MARENTGNGRPSRIPRIATFVESGSRAAGGGGYCGGGRERVGDSLGRRDPVNAAERGFFVWEWYAKGGLTKAKSPQNKERKWKGARTGWGGVGDRAFEGGTSGKATQGLIGGWRKEKKD